MKTSVRIISVVGLIAAVGGPAAYALPPDRTITYEIHDIPTDPQSDVTFILDLDISAVVATVEGDAIGWDITAAVFTQPGGTGSTIWSIADPYVDTPSGLWWVDHADINRPSLAEFIFPPSLVGTAEPDDPQDDDLNYDLVGVEYQGTPPYTVTSGLDYSFALAAEPEKPIKDGNDEPTDVVG